MVIMNSNGKPSGGYTYEERQTGSSGYRPSPKPPKKKLRFKPNKEGMLALALLVLVVIVVITLLVLTIKAIAGAVSGEKPAETTTASETTGELPVVKTWHDGYTQKSVSSSDVFSGNLILVNFENIYANTDAIKNKVSSLYGTSGYGSNYVLGSDFKIRNDIATPLRQMLADLIAANPETLGNSDNKIILTSGYRTVEKQTELYDRSVGTADENLVAKPGYSEHHTGYAIDIKIYVYYENGKTATIDLRDNEQLWMEQNCAKYGFVVRYDGSKFEKTGILDETWHYRYVGIPHAAYMMENNLCLEEYLELLRLSHAYPDEPLSITAGETEYLVYYVKASGDSTTFIPVPPESVGTYEISGDNMNGYIVTVTKK